LVYEKKIAIILLINETRRIFKRKGLSFFIRFAIKKVKTERKYIKTRLIDSVHLPKNELYGSIPHIELTVIIIKKITKTICSGVIRKDIFLSLIMPHK
jgi:hypothetical protein